MTRRPGMTMTEVLVTIFVVAIGLAGVMSMFPFAAKQMSDALISDRATSLATSTDGLVRGYWQEKVVENNGNGEPFWEALDDPDRTGYFHPFTTSTTRLPRALPNEPSYPVFLDPMGVYRSSTDGPKWVGDAGKSTFVPRRTMNSVSNDRMALRMFSQADGFSWDEDSKPKPGLEMRELRYNALAVIQRPTNRDRFGATLKIVVFLNRRHQFYPTGSEAVFPNSAAPAVVRFTPGNTQIQLSTSADIKKGSWIMDATIAPVVPLTTPKTYIRHANFYRVVSATENTAGTYDVELHTPIKRVDGGTAAYDATVVVMAGVAEVFDRPVLTSGVNP